MAQNKNNIAIGGKDQFIRIYTMSGGLFVLSETINIGINIY